MIPIEKVDEQPTASIDEPTSVQIMEPPPKTAKRPVFSEKALASAQRLYDKDFARAPEDGIVQVGTDSAIVAAKTLGLSKKAWGVRGLRAKEQLGKYLNQPLQLRRILAVDTMDTIQQIRDVIAAGNKLANGVPIQEGATGVIRPEDRAKAITAVALASHALVDLSSLMIKLADRGEAGGGDAPPPNKPPSFGLEVTSPDGTTTRAVANTGG